MSASTSPRKLVKKQSLSILSSSHINQLNNAQQNDSKPAKDRIISESTGLIKFSLKKPNNSPSEENVFVRNATRHKEKTQTPTASPERPNHGIPIYVPINNETKPKHELDTQEILFELASKQRIVMDLEEQLKQAKLELQQLETKYNNSTTANSPLTTDTKLESDQKTPSTPKGLASVAQSIRKTTSLMNMNINTPKLNSDIVKTQKQVSESFNQFTNNFTKNNFFSKGKNFIETNFQKNVLMGNELLNSIFEKHESTEEDISVDSYSKTYDYSVDMDLNRLNKMKAAQNYKRSILEDLEDVDEDNDEYYKDEFTNGLNRVLSESSECSEEDYGGEAVRI